MLEVELTYVTLCTEAAESYDLWYQSASNAVLIQFVELWAWCALYSILFFCAAISRCQIFCCHFVRMCFCVRPVFNGAFFSLESIYSSWKLNMYIFFTIFEKMKYQNNFLTTHIVTLQGRAIWSKGPCTNHVDNEGGGGYRNDYNCLQGGGGCQGFVHVDKNLINFSNVCSIVNAT